MNWQFFATAGVVSGVLWIVTLVMFVLLISEHFTYDTEEVFNVIMWVCFLLPIAFWLIIGVICGLNAIWGWGLVK